MFSQIPINLFFSFLKNSSLKRPAYEEQIHSQIKSGHVLNATAEGSSSPCSEDFSLPRLRGSSPEANVLYIKMEDAKGEKNSNKYLVVFETSAQWNKGVSQR